MHPSVAEIFRAGRLGDAIAAASDGVKTAPSDPDGRWLLVELLCIAGDDQRAAHQLDALTTLEPKALVAASLVQRLLEAAMERRACFEAEGVPVVHGGDSIPAVSLCLEALALRKRGQSADAGRAAAAAERQRPRFSGTLNGVPFDDFRDCDDITASVFEVLTPEGGYRWVPMQHVERLECRPPQRPLDLIWRPATLALRGADAEGDLPAVVYLPTVYGVVPAGNDEARLARRTDWIGADGEAIVGVGQRTFLAAGVGADADREVEMLSLSTISTT